MFNRNRFVLALIAGVALQIGLLLMALHASLFFAGFTSGRVYWALNAAYMVCGVSLVLALVPWHRPVIRVAIALALVVGAALARIAAGA